MKRIIITSTLIGFVFCTISPGILKAQMSVYKLHSLFVYNFVKNIKWENVGEEFVIGIYGKPEAFSEFDHNFSNKNFNGKKFNIKNISNASDAKSCQIVYLPKTNLNKTKALITALEDQRILVVTEEDLIADGASISFELVGSKLNFIINKSKTDQQGLKVSSSLLALGTVIG